MTSLPTPNLDDRRFQDLVDEAKRREMYREMAMLVRDEGGTILPMFNDFVNAGSKKLMGYVNDIGNDMSNGYVATRVWLDS